MAALRRQAGETVNFAVHVQLRNMRGYEGDSARAAPSGVLFSLVSCPNYTSEVVSWIGFCIVSQLLAAYVFTAIGFATMTRWALAKHAGYVKQDKGVRRRKAIVPFVI